MSFKIADHVVVHYPDGDPAPGYILSGPLVKDDKTIYQVDHGDFDNWVVEDQLEKQPTE